MARIYSSTFFKFLSRNKAYTAISIIGLAISLMFVILISVYIYQELSVDKFQKDADRICLQFQGMPEEGGMYYTPMDALPVAYWLKERYPDIEAVCPVVGQQAKGTPVHYADRVANADFFFTESNFFTFFSFPLIEGDPESVLQDAYSAVVSESFARKLFGDEDPVGKSVRITDSTSVVVKGVMADIRNSILPYADMLLRVERVTEFNGNIGLDRDGNAGCTLTFLKMLPGQDMNRHHDDVLDFYKERYWIYNKEFSTEVEFVPLRDAYFEVTEAWLTRSGDKGFVHVLMAVGILILLFSVFNYINLTVAQSGFRAKEVATERLLGASRFSVMLRLVGEALFLSLVAYLLVLGRRHSGGCPVGASDGDSIGLPAGSVPVGGEAGGYCQRRFRPAIQDGVRQGFHGVAKRNHDSMLAAGLFCALVSFVAVFWQSFRAANADPIRGVRQE